VQEPTQPPIWEWPLTGRDAALVAGFLLHFRQGVLNALETGELWDPTLFPEWQVPVLDFYKAGEQWTRYLLWQTGYRVAKGEQWGEESSVVRP
jgi:hypothetical protein